MKERKNQNRNKYSSHFEEDLFKYQIIVPDIKFLGRENKYF